MTLGVVTTTRRATAGQMCFAGMIPLVANAAETTPPPPPPSSSASSAVGAGERPSVKMRRSVHVAPIVMAVSCVKNPPAAPRPLVSSGGAHSLPKLVAASSCISKVRLTHASVGSSASRGSGTLACSSVRSNTLNAEEKTTRRRRFVASRNSSSIVNGFPLGTRSCTTMKRCVSPSTVRLSFGSVSDVARPPAHVNTKPRTSFEYAFFTFPVIFHPAPGSVPFSTSTSTQLSGPWYEAPNSVRCFRGAALIVRVKLRGIKN